jgi:vacuolar-type H+-ATPase subunit H
MLFCFAGGRFSRRLAFRYSLSDLWEIYPTDGRLALKDVPFCGIICCNVFMRRRGCAAGNIKGEGGVWMSLEAITSVTRAEQEAKNAVAAAQAKAKQLLAEAQAAGEASLEAARAKADSELEALRKKAEEKSQADAEALGRGLEAEREALRKKAEGKLDAAAALIVERIVND